MKLRHELKQTFIAPAASARRRIKANKGEGKFPSKSVSFYARETSLSRLFMPPCPGIEAPFLFASPLPGRPRQLDGLATITLPIVLERTVK
jgi:hypothetical protein